MRKAVDKQQKKNTLNAKIKLNKKQIIIIVFVILGVLAVVVSNNYTALGLVLNKNIDSEDAVQVELQTSNNTIIPFGNEVLVYNKGSIKSYNTYGKQTGEIKLEDTIEADIQTAGKYIQVINKAKGLVYVYKNKYEIARIKLDGNIYSGNINTDGTSVIEYSSNGNKTALGIYDDSGKMKYNIKLSNNILGKYVLSENSKYLVYVDVNISGISSRTNINVIDLSIVNDEENGIKVAHTIDNSLAYDVYWQNSNIIVRFEEYYMIYNAVSEEKELLSISERQIVDIEDFAQKYAYTSLDENGNYAAVIKKMKSDKQTSILIKEAPKYLKYENGIMYVCYNKQIEAYNNFGMNIKNYYSDMVITEPVVFNNGRSVAMAVSNKLILFTI